MIPLFNGLRGVSFLPVLFRVALALLCGGAIGMERSYKNRAAGFRTHILICAGGTVASMTGLYLYLVAHLSTDVSRLGAQVVSGLGFIGAGTIVVNRTREPAIRGLNTAAGVWATGIIGLAIGAGFYEGALVGTALILLTEIAFARIGRRPAGLGSFRLILHYRHKLALDQVLRHCKDLKLAITDLKVSGTEVDGQSVYSAAVALRPRKSVDKPALLRYVTKNREIIRAEIDENVS